MVVNLLEEWVLKDQIIDSSVETTSDKTGNYKGSCKLIEESVGHAILWLSCRRHVYELHIKHVAKLIAQYVSGRDSKSPEVVEDEDWVNTDQLTKFDWEAERNSFIRGCSIIM